jgi:hypothetical protein
MWLLRRIKTYLSFSFLVACSGLAFAQSSEQPVEKMRLRYFNQYLAGPIIGDKLGEASFHASTFHGIAWRRLALAPGLSYDTYDSWKVLHYAATASLEVGNIANGAPMLVLTAGKEAHVNNPDQQLTGWNYGNKRATFYQASFGYRFPMRGGSLFALAGYRLQTLKYTQTPRWFLNDMMMNWASPYYSHLEQDTRRVVLQVGFSFR